MQHNIYCNFLGLAELFQLVKYPPNHQSFWNLAGKTAIQVENLTSVNLLYLLAGYLMIKPFVHVWLLMWSDFKILIYSDVVIVTDISCSKLKVCLSVTCCPDPL